MQQRDRRRHVEPGRPQQVAVAQHLLCRAVGHYLPLNQQHRALCQAGQLVQIVRDHHERGPAALVPVPDAVQQLPPATWIQPRGGLVQDQYLRLRGQDACQCHPAHLTAAEGERHAPDHRARLHPHHPQCPVHPLLQVCAGLTAVAQPEGDLAVDGLFEDLVLWDLER